MKNTYNDVLKVAIDQSAITTCSLSRAEIEKAIADITERLRGPMSNGERLLLVADRSELRATLATMQP